MIFLENSFSVPSMVCRTPYPQQFCTIHNQVTMATRCAPHRREYQCAPLTRFGRAQQRNSVH
eukprot:scaffold250096_cov28-Tisochrysis_lutea.AAC.3